MFGEFFVHLYKLFKNEMTRENTREKEQNREKIRE